DRRDELPSHGWATSAVQLGAAALLGGGFYYGFAKQTKVAQEDAPAQKHAGEFLEKMESRKFTWMERRLGLHRPLNPNSAAWRALFGGTAAAVSGCAVLLVAGSAALGIRNVHEFRQRMEDVFPRMRRRVLTTLNIKPKTSPEDFPDQEKELNELAALFAEGSDTTSTTTQATKNE
ncbi:TPA: hypothetical protein N0F65_002058, partial [Lagenidium giganteum]